MNSRPAPTLFFASQPSSQLPSYEQRQNTIPTPPFPVQVPPPSQTFFNNDVFLARKREQNQQNYEKQQLEIDRPGQANARESSYAASQAIDAMSKAMDEIEGLRTWERREDRKMDRYGSHGTEGMRVSILYIAAILFVCVCCHLHLHPALLSLARSILHVRPFSATPIALLHELLCMYCHATKNPCIFNKAQRLSKHFMWSQLSLKASIPTTSFLCTALQT